MSRIAETTRQQVRLRANGRCEYCRKSEMVSTYEFHVDHIIPPMHGGSSDFNNLAWACFECNVKKGTNVASYDPYSEELTPLYNPRTQSWSEHFEVVDDQIVGKTPVGRVTVNVLDMNHPDQRTARHIMIVAGGWDE
jgi:hypothetical protein